MSKKKYPFIHRKVFENKRSFAKIQFWYDFHRIVLNHNIFECQVKSSERTKTNQKNLKLYCWEISNEKILPWMRTITRIWSSLLLIMQPSILFKVVVRYGQVMPDLAKFCRIMQKTSTLWLRYPRLSEATILCYPRQLL